MHKTGSQQEYPKNGKTTSLKPLTPGKPVGERLANRMLLPQAVAGLSEEQRVLGNYAKEPRAPQFDKSPRNGTDGQKTVVTEGGLASRGNVIHGRYKPSL